MYYFYDKFDDIIYIGKAKSFRSRFQQHASNSYFFAHVTNIKAFVLDSPVDRDIYETYFINYYRPQYNVGKMWSAEPTVDYDELIYEYEAEIESLLEEMAEWKSVLAPPTEFDDDETHDWDYASEDDRLLYEFGESLYAMERIAEIRDRLRELKRLRDTAKNFVI